MRRCWLSYTPEPIDNRSIELSPELHSLIEMLARNNHELWAARRMAEGWRYGAKRDDGKKETPVLVIDSNVSHRFGLDIGRGPAVLGLLPHHPTHE